MTALIQGVFRGAMTALGTTITIERVDALSPRVRRIHAAGPEIERMAWTPGDKIKLHVGRGLMRSYTPSRVDPERGTMELIVHLHGQGPASAWAAALQGGEVLSFFGPARSMPSDGLEHAPWALMLGDETALGLAVALMDACEPETDRLGAIELHPDDLAAVDALDLPLHAVPRDAEHGASLLEWLAETWVPPGDGVAWLSGEASSVLGLRTALLERGLGRSQLRVKPYWSVRGKAHRKQLERGALVA